MKSSSRAFVVCAMCCAAGAFSSFGAVSGTFNGVDGSGDISVGGNWSNGSVPDGYAFFDKSGDLTAGAPVSLQTVYFRGTAMSWVMRDFGDDRVSMNMFRFDGSPVSVGNHLLLTNGTLTVKTNSPIIGGDGCPSNVVEVGKDATLIVPGVSIGGSRGANKTAAPGNALLISEGGTLRSSAKINIGAGSDGGHPNCRLEARGAKLIETTGTSSSISLNSAGGCALFHDTEKVLIGGNVMVGADNAPLATNIMFVASNVTEMVFGYDTYVFRANRLVLQDVKKHSFSRGVHLKDGSSLSISKVGVLDISPGMTVAEDAVRDVACVEIADIGSLTLGALAVKNGAYVEIRDMVALTNKYTNVGSGGTLVMSNLTSVVGYPGADDDFYINSDDAGGASAQLFMPADYNPRNIRIGNKGVSAHRQSLIYGASGGCVTNAAQGATLSNFFQDSGTANTSVELRDGQYFLYDLRSGQTLPESIAYTVTNPDRTYIIGRGATLTVPQTRNSPAFSQNPQTSAYGARVDNAAIVVDGGTFRLPSANGTYAMGRVDRGEAGVFQVVNGGLLWADANFIIGEGSGIADSCAVRVATGGQIKADGFHIKTSNNRTVVSNGTVSVANCCWPPSGCKYPNDAHFGDKKNTPRDVTNNVIRIEGASSRLVATGGIYAEQDDGQTVETILEFAVPEDGFDEANPPIQAGEGMAFHGKLAVRVDPTAYTGYSRWMTVMKTDSGVISADDLDLSELPAGVKVRLSDDGKLLQIRAGKPYGLMMIIR